MNKLYFLMLKTHNKTNLKYLCFHHGTKDSCYRYNGSGSYWTAHLSKHGKDITTEILLESTNRDEISKKGIELSREWDIVTSKEYANLTVEDAQTTAEPLQRPEIRRKRNESMKARILKYGLTEKEINAKRRVAKILQSPEIREKAANTFRSRLANGDFTLKERERGIKNSHRIKLEGHTDAEKRAHKETSLRQKDKTMAERLGNLNYKSPKLGKSMREICGEDYTVWNKGKSMKGIKGPGYIDLRSRPFRIVSHLDEQVFENERDFLSQMNFSGPVLTKLKKNGSYTVKRQSNTAHPYKHGETIYFQFI